MLPLLVLWDVDDTLADTNGVGRHLYQVVLAELYGLDLPSPIRSMAGRTDTSIALEVLTAAGVPAPETEVRRFQDLLAARAPELDAMVRERGRALPGVPEAGNIPALARVKLGALGLTEHLDLSVGAYGDVSEIRADLVPIARQAAKASYGTDFAGRSTVLVGDTENDIEAAAVNGARSVGVATGSFTEQQLADAGADVVLADLSDCARVVSAVLHGKPS